MSHITDQEVQRLEQMVARREAKLIDAKRKLSAAILRAQPKETAKP
jgi:hypothetical protein